MTKSTIKTYALCSTALMALAYAPSAFAQAAAGTGAEAASAEEVVVTGSRIITNGFAQPTPVTVLTMTQMQETAPNSLSDAINQLPEFRQSLSPQTSSFNPGAFSPSGAAFINLRGLSPRRGLTLLNGERIVSNSAQAGSAVDLNVLPQSLVKHIDVVTGGASAAYGSDALAGVVNLVLDTKFTGVKGEIRGGISTYGDDDSLATSIAAGTAFAGGKGHIIGSFEYYHTDGIKNYASGGRDWTKGAVVASFTNPNCPSPQTSTSCPTRIVTGPVINTTLTSGGLITGSTLTGAAAAAIQNLTFIGNAGATQPFPYGTLRTATNEIGGGIDAPMENAINFLPTNLRMEGYSRVEYEVAPNWTAHADLMYGWSASKYLGELGYDSGQATNSTAYPTGGTAGFVIFADNPYLPASISSLLKTQPVGATALSLYNPATGLFNGPKENSIVVGRVDTDWPVQYNFSNYSTLRVSGGIDGKFHAVGTDWTLTGYGTYGRGMHTSSTTNDAILTNLFNAVDAVASPGGPGLAAAGTPICRSTITNPTNACVPLNVLGQNVATPAALNYIYGGSANGDSHFSQVLTQSVGDFSIHGEPFSTWAGPVSLGGGASYRKETVTTVADPISDGYNPAIPGTPVFKPGLSSPLTINGFPGETVTAGLTAGAGAPRGVKGGFMAVNNGSGFPGSLDVKEVFVETLIPILKDNPLARSLNINAAFRYADYQYGGGVENWKVGVVWETPIEGLKVRSTRSRDVRAPNLNDLFAGQTLSLAGGTDPFRLGTTGLQEAAPGNALSAGNPNLKPEVGDTFTLGAVYSPDFIPGLTLSVDYFSIIINGEINSLSAQTVINQCYSGNTALCTLITRNPDPTSFGAGNTIGPITQVFTPTLNFGYQKLAGLDIEASYNLPLARFWADRKDVLNFRVLMNYQGKNATYITGSPSITNTVGIVGGGVIQGTGGNYDWAGSLNVNYRNGPLTVNLQERFINGGRIQANVDDAGNPYPYNIFVNPNGTSAATESGQVPNTVPAYFYTDLSVNYRFGRDDRYEAFLTINNLLNKDPPALGLGLLPYGVQPTNYSSYDGVGRAYTAGLRFKF